MIKHTKNIVVNDCSDIPLEIIEDIKIINFYCSNREYKDNRKEIRDD